MAAEDVDMMSQHSSSNPLPNARDQENLRTAASRASGRHHAYRGIRLRRGKWVSEIREPRKTTRVWLGTYPTPEMAAAAYDVAALALKGPEALINFPGLAPTYPLPASFSADDIRAAAASAAAALAPRRAAPGDQVHAPPPENVASSSEHAPAHDFIDEEALFHMPKLLVDMAEGMLVSPPRMKSAADDDEDPAESYSGNDSLWSYL